MRYETLKRALDLSGAVIGLVLTAPLIALTALAVRAWLGAPALFRQVRPGRYGRPFVIYKFRTMLEVRDARGDLLPSEQRLTPLGRFLRSTSLDELPELFNVMKGDMSLVGPRPLMWQYLPRYTREQARRHDVRPGITGWAQIHGRNTVAWEERFALDVWYVDHHTLWLDLQILARTILLVATRAGVHPAGRDIMEEFRGAAGSPTPRQPEALL